MSLRMECGRSPFPALYFALDMDQNGHSTEDKDCLVKNSKAQEYMYIMHFVTVSIT